MKIQESVSLNRKQLSVFLEPKGKEEDFRLLMLQRNAIDFLLPVQKLYEEGTVHYVYDTTEKESFLAYSKGKRLKEEMVKKFFTQLFTALCRGKEYYFDEDSYLMNPESIFIDTSQNRYYYCYCPDYVEPIRQQIVSVVGLFMNLIDYEDLSAVKLVYQLYQMVGEETFSTNKILSYVKKYHFEEEKNKEKSQLITITPELEKEFAKVSTIVKEGVPGQPMSSQSMSGQSILVQSPPIQPPPVRPIPIQSPPIQPSPIPPTQTPPPPSPPYSTPSQSAGQRDTTEPEMVLHKGTIAFILSSVAFFILFCAGYAGGLFYTKIGHQLDIKKIVVYIILVLVVEGYIAWKAFGDTTKQDSPSTGTEYKLLPYSNGPETIWIKQFPFYIGKDSTQVNGTIMNPQVSRMHAIITMVEGKLYLQDVNSLNGTYVNEMRLQPQVNQLIHTGDTIRFAGAAYRLSN